MAGRLQFNVESHVASRIDSLPLPVWKGNKQVLQALQKRFDQTAITGETDLYRVFQNQRQQQSRRLRAVNRPCKPRRQQIRDTSDMVDMHMSNDQSLDMIDGKVDDLARFTKPLILASRISDLSLFPLEQTTVDENSGLLRQAQFMAGAGHPAQGAVMEYLRIQVVQGISPAQPSHFSGTLPFRDGLCRNESAASRTLAGSFLTSTLVPSLQQDENALASATTPRVRFRPPGVDAKPVKQGGPVGIFAKHLRRSIPRTITC